MFNLSNTHYKELMQSGFIDINNYISYLVGGSVKEVHK